MSATASAGVNVELLQFQNYVLECEGQDDQLE